MAAFQPLPNTSHILFLIPELLDQVIEYHPSDLTTLRSCSLVSRGWTPVVQRYLFSSVTVLADHPSRNLCSFIVLLRTQPFSYSSIRAVHIKAHPSAVLSRSSVDHAPIKVSELQITLSFLPRLHTLSIGAVSVLPDLPPFICGSKVVQHGNRTRCKLNSLRLQNTRIYQLGSMAASLFGFLDLFSIIEALNIDGVEFTRPPSSLTSPVAQSYPASQLLPMLGTKLPIRALEFKPTNVGLANVLVDCVSLQHLESVCLGGDGPWYVSGRLQEYQTYATTAGACMRKMEVPVPLAHAYDDVSVLDLSTCLVLEDLTLTFTLVSSYRCELGVENAWRPAAAVLSSLPPSSPLLTLRLVFYAPVKIATDTKLRIGSCGLGPEILVPHVLERFQKITNVSVDVAVVQDGVAMSTSTYELWDRERQRVRACAAEAVRTVYADGLAGLREPRSE